MTMRMRLVLAGLTGALWYGFISPKFMDRIHQQRSRGLTLDAVETIQEILDRDTGELDPLLEETIDTLNGLKKKEDERISAMMDLLDQDALIEARAGLKDLPPPRYKLDHRFFEPLVPELTVLIIENYGYAVEPLAEAAGPVPPGRRADKLEILLSLVHHKLLSDEHAAQILSGVMELSAIEVKRRALEETLRDALSGQDSGL